MVGCSGLWPGVVAIASGVDMYCVPCAKRRYGSLAIQVVIDGSPGYERFGDRKGNPLTMCCLGVKTCAAVLW
jgi:hypothetical protein